MGVGIFDFMQEEGAWLLSAWNFVETLDDHCVSFLGCGAGWSFNFGVQDFAKLFFVYFVLLDLQNPLDVGSPLRKTFAPDYHLIKLIRIRNFYTLLIKSPPTDCSDVYWAIIPYAISGRKSQSIRNLSGSRHIS